MTIGQLRLMRDSETELPENFPSRSLYPIAYDALEEFMTSGGNNLRSHNTDYWETILEKMDSVDPNYDDELIVIPTPVNFCIENEAPSKPTNGSVTISPDGNSVLLSVLPSTDPDSNDLVTHDVYLGLEGGALLLVARDVNVPVANLEDLAPGRYVWRVVSKDSHGGLNYGPLWNFATDGTAWGPNPADGAIDVIPNVELSWTPGIFASSHNVYLGTDFNDVNDANTSSMGIYKGNQGPNSYDPPGILDLETTYYWRIDEVNGPNTWNGKVWRFTTANYIVIDNFESYNETDNPVFNTWIEGYWWNGNGSIVWLGITPVAPVHGGQQSMGFWYENSVNWDNGYYSEISADPLNLPIGSGDWTVHGVKALMLFFYGDPNNDSNETEQLYVGLEDSIGTYAEVKYGPDMNDIKIAEWQQWDIALSEFNDVNLASVQTFYIGFGDRDNAIIPGGDGFVYFDDIRLYPARCIPELAPVEDLSGNCIVDYFDIQIMAFEWLLNGDGLVADLYLDGGVDFRDYAVLMNAWLEEQLWPE